MRALLPAALTSSFAAIAGAIMAASSAATLPFTGSISYSAFGSDNHTHIYLLSDDGEITQLTTGEHDDATPEWSPDGKRIVFQRADNDGSSVYVVNSDGAGLKRLSPTPGRDALPAFSADGSDVIFVNIVSQNSCNGGAMPTTNVTTMSSIDGSARTTLIDGARASTCFNVEPRVAPDGSAIAYMCAPSDGSIQTCIAKPDGSGAKAITHGEGTVAGDPHWAWDSRRLAISRRDTSGNVNVWTLRADGSDLTQLTTFVQPIEGGDAGWSPDNSQLAFEEDNGGVGQSVRDAPAGISIVDADGSGYVRLQVPCSDVGCGPRFRPHVSSAAAPATQQMVFMLPVSNTPVPSPTAMFEVAMMNLDGTALRQLTNDGTQKFLPHFSADATKIVYTKFTSGGYGAANARSEVAVFDLVTSTETELTHSGGASQPTFSPDGQRIAFGQGCLSHADDGAMGLYVMNTDGSDVQRVAVANGANDDLGWCDFAWSSNDWIMFVVAQNIDGCFKARIDKIRPDGNGRTKVTDGGSQCSLPGRENTGDADPGWSADMTTIYSSRGLATPPGGAPENLTQRRLYAVSSDAWFPGKVELDLSLPTRPDCIEGVPKAAPNGTQVLLFRACFNAGQLDQPGIYLADSAGSYRTFVTQGFGADFNPRIAPAGSVLPVETVAMHVAPWQFVDPQPITIQGYSGDAMEPQITAYGTYLIFNNSNAPSVDTNLHYAQRADDLHFVYKGEITGANSSALDGAASIDRHGIVYFVSTRSYPQTLSTIYRGRFRDGVMSEVEIVPGISTQQPGKVNFDVAVNAAGDTLYFVDSQFANGAPQTARLAIAERAGASFQRAANSDELLSNINTAALQYAAAISADGLHLFFTRLDADGPHIYQAWRDAATEAFSMPHRIAAIDGFTEGPALSPDENSLYFHRAGANGFSIYRVTRMKGRTWPQPRRTP